MSSEERDDRHPRQKQKSRGWLAFSGVIPGGSLLFGKILESLVHCVPYCRTKGPCRDTRVRAYNQGCACCIGVSHRSRYTTVCTNGRLESDSEPRASVTIAQVSEVISLARRPAFIDKRN